VVYTSGFELGPAQEGILPICEDHWLLARYAVVKVSYICRLWMATYTDTFPVYVYIKQASTPAKSTTKPATKEL
jgi:hypothetical protein